jgi:hypothetical protein
MNFSVAEIWVDSGVTLAAFLGVVLAYMVGAALAGRRFGARGIWAACAVMVALVCVLLLRDAGSDPYTRPFAGAVGVAVAALPALASAWLLA